MARPEIFTLQAAQTAPLPPELTPLLGPCFRRWYSEPPWDERWRCPQCSPPGDYGVAGRYSQPDLTRCQECDSPLEEYWTNERTLAYLRSATQAPGGWLLLGWTQYSQIAAWTWGYGVSAELASTLSLPPGGRYVDIIGVLEQYRGFGGSREFIAKVTKAVVEGHGSMPPAPYGVTRTHTVARHVTFAMARAGWEDTGLVSPDDPQRGYWVLRQPA